MPFSATHAVILGGSSGIGIATARRMLQEGARVTIVGRSEARTREAAAETGARAEVGDGRDQTAMIDLLGRIGPVGHLVLSARRGAPAAGPSASLTRTI